MSAEAFHECMHFLRGGFIASDGRMTRKAFHRICDERGVLPHEAMVYFEAMGMRVVRAPFNARQPNQNGAVRPHLSDMLVVPIYEPEVVHDTVD